ncbi:hypothetical protein EBI_27365 [Enterocytozoon bieneusi H348]|nr:hypothetical protein EBI_27365 [Enterocytozoon bieneusi H348]|eukprot:XP_002650945.1 hypothetical protein EBI_27365 [Enterocytozoon bieneusi H348]
MQRIFKIKKGISPKPHFLCPNKKKTRIFGGKATQKFGFTKSKMLFKNKRGSPKKKLYSPPPLKN